MKIPIQKQIDFLNWQLQEIDELYRAYLAKPMKTHFADRSAFFGKIWGIDEKRGNLILSFDYGMAPRLNMPLSGFLFRGVPDVRNLDTWNFSYSTFREKYAVVNTDILPIYFMNDRGRSFNLVGCRDVGTDFLDLVRGHLDKGNRPSIVLAERDPPVQYLINLRSFIGKYPDDKILNLPIDKNLDTWQPKQFPDQTRKKEELTRCFKTSEEIIVQGPPGTGKSYLIAELTQSLLDQGEAVCVTALTNKALMEVAEKPGIQIWAEKGRVHKTNLTINEHYENRKLKPAESLGVGKGNLLLATYYKLSDWYNPNSSTSFSSFPVYDTIIIEEASQCYLATIAAFKKLGKKVLIVGDPMQLPPIVLNEKNASSIHPNIRKFTHGLETYAANGTANSYLLHQTYRLSPEAASLTGIFYNKRLESIQEDFQPLMANHSFLSLVPKNGGTKIKYLPIIAEGDKPIQAIEYIIEFLIQLRLENPGIEIAILAPFKKTVLALQEKVGQHFTDQSQITIETIDRIQGLTVDFTIYLLALNNPSFAMNLNRFNVATSRARQGTLIITDKDYVRFMGINPLVTQYLGVLEVAE